MILFIIIEVYQKVFVIEAKNKYPKLAYLFG